MSGPRLCLPAILVAAALATLIAVPAASAADPSPSPSHAADPSVAPPAGWTYLALGDSNVYGPPDACGYCRTYPHLLTDRIEAELGIPVTLIDGSQYNKLTSAKLLAEIRRDSWGEPREAPHDAALSPRQAIAAADLITITVAANEVAWYLDPDPCGGVFDAACIEKTVTPYGQNMDAVLAEIAQIRAGKPTAVRVTTFYNDLLTGPGYDPTWFFPAPVVAQALPEGKAYVEALNNAIGDAATANGAVVVDIYHAANGPDGTQAIPPGFFVPTYGDLNQSAQDLYAAEILKVGFEPLTRAVIAP